VEIKQGLRKILITQIMILSISPLLLYSQEIPKRRIADTTKKRSGSSYKKEERYSLIKNYPPEIQRLDSIKASYYKKKSELERSGKKFEYTDKFVKEYASAYFSSYLFNTNVDGSGLHREYFLKTYPMGSEFGRKFSELPYPWNILNRVAGIVLVDVIGDTILPRAKSSNQNRYKYVLIGRVVDDIFDTIEEDTILIRYDYPVSNEELFKQNKNIQLLFVVQNRGTIQRETSNETIRDDINLRYSDVDFIYKMGSGNKYRKEHKYMFVIDGVIQDPYNVLGLSGKSYNDFKDDLLKTCKKEGIRR